MNFSNKRKGVFWASLASGRSGPRRRSVQLSRTVMSDSLGPHGLYHTRLRCPPLSPSLLKFMSVESMMPSHHLILCCPLLLLPSIFPTVRVFSNESALCIRWSKYWHFSFSISPSNEYSGLISLRTDWFDLLAVQRTQESSLTPQWERINSSALNFL